MMADTPNGMPAILLRYKHSICQISLLILAILMPLKFGVQIDLDMEFFIFLGYDNTTYQQS